MDVSPLINQSNSSAATQTQLANLLLGKLQGYNAPYQADIAGQVKGAQDATKSLGDQYVSDSSKAGDMLGSSLSDALMQRTLQANQQTNNALKENLAATGGLQRGGADAAFQGQAATVANTIGQGQQAIVQQQLAARLGALDTAYGNNNAMVGTGLGLNTGASGTVLNNNVNATTNNGNQLLGIESNRNNNLLGALSTKINSDTAQEAAGNQMVGNLLGAGIGAAGSVGGAIYGGRANPFINSSMGRGAVNSVPQGR